MRQRAEAHKPDAAGLSVLPISRESRLVNRHVRHFIHYPLYTTRA
jgi:hypothetical protein